MATIQEQIAALEAAIASGIRTVSYSDRQVTYQTVEEMLAALARLEALAGGESASGTRSTFASPRRD